MQNRMIWAGRDHEDLLVPHLLQGAGYLTLEDHHALPSYDCKLFSFGNRNFDFILIKLSVCNLPIEVLLVGIIQLPWL